MFKSVSQCMEASDSDVLKAAKQSNTPEYLTLDVKKNKMTICSTISGHQQQAFVKGAVNPRLMHTMKKQKEDCDSMCK
jgi:hypothetical protein